MSTGRGEAGFSEATRRIIRERAAYRCIASTCDEVTIGPGASTSETANTGTACHISLNMVHEPLPSHLRLAVSDRRIAGTCARRPSKGGLTPP